MTPIHRDGPLSHDHAWKAYRLHLAGWAPDTIARMWGRDVETEITPAIERCRQIHEGTPAPHHEPWKVA